MSNFQVLKKYVGLDSGSKRFLPVNENDIISAEKEIGHPFPAGLKDFYKSVGYGWLGSEENNAIRNLFIHPLDIADLYKGTSEFAPPEGFLDGDVPFFDCGGSRFLVFRLGSENSESIYRDNGETKELSVNINDFIERLTLDPSFYEKPIDA